MAKKIDAGIWDRFFDIEEGGGIDLGGPWPTIAESDSWDEWMKGGTWVAARGEDFIHSAKEFAEELQLRAREANLDVNAVWQGSRQRGVLFHFYRFLKPEQKKEVSKPMPARDEETGEYLGYWWMPDGTWIPMPVWWHPRVTNDADKAA